MPRGTSEQQELATRRFNNAGTRTVGLLSGERQKNKNIALKCAQAKQRNSLSLHTSQRKNSAVDGTQTRLNASESNEPASVHSAMQIPHAKSTSTGKKNSAAEGSNAAPLTLGGGKLTTRTTK